MCVFLFETESSTKASVHAVGSGELKSWILALVHAMGSRQLVYRSGETELVDPDGASSGSQTQVFWCAVEA